MRRNPVAALPLLAMLLLLAVDLPARAACTAANPNAHVLESTPTSGFTVNGDSTVTHAKTGLMWKQCSEGLSGAACATGTATLMTWQNALKAANTANTAIFAGHADWRLPNQKELGSIVEFCGFNPAINRTVFPATPSALFWSGTSDVRYPSFAWNVAFDFGFTNSDGKTGDYSVSAYVRLVRGGQSVDSFDLLNPTSSHVVYDGNGSTGGSVPVDSNAYAAGDPVTVLGNTGSLVKTGYTFGGWNTAANGSGTSYAGGATFAMGSSNVTLYAKWTPTYTVTYNGNTNTGGTVPIDGNAYVAGATVTVLGNTGSLVKTGYTFGGWNTAANGSGTSYAGGATFAMGSGNITLYAKWTLIPTYSVTYNGNTNTGGTVPVDGNAYAAGATVTVLGNTGKLVKTGYTFGGWNTAANGSGTSYAGGATFAVGSGNVTLYAKWKLFDITPILMLLF
jgi:uncharacterized repeat protein (TIGR02543 family)